MNKKTFSLLAVMSALAFIAITFAPAARADDAGLVSFGATNTLTAASTNSVTSVVKIDKQHGAALVLKTSGTQAGTGNIVVILARSYDGTNFETVPPATLRFTNALAGATTVIGIHEIADKVINSAHSLKISAVWNMDASASGTNTTIGLIKKLER